MNMAEENLNVKNAQELLYVCMVDKNLLVKNAEEPLYMNIIE